MPAVPGGRWRESTESATRGHCSGRARRGRHRRSRGHRGPAREVRAGASRARSLRIEPLARQPTRRRETTSATGGASDDDVDHAAPGRAVAIPSRRRPRASPAARLCARRRRGDWRARRAESRPAAVPRAADAADRLDAVGRPMRVNDGVHEEARRSSSTRCETGGSRAPQGLLGTADLAGDRLDRVSRRRAFLLVLHGAPPSRTARSFTSGETGWSHAGTARLQPLTAWNLRQTGGMPSRAGAYARGRHTDENDKRRLPEGDGVVVLSRGAGI